MKNELELTEDDVRAACVAYVKGKGYDVRSEDVEFVVGVYDFGECVEFEGVKIDLDDCVDPYDGDPRNEVADLATRVNFDYCADGRVFVDYETDGLYVSTVGPISWVLPILRAAAGGGR